MGAPGTAIQNQLNRPSGILFKGVYFDARHFEEAKNALDIIIVRGLHSQKTLEEYGIESLIVGDTALLLEPEEYHTNASDKIVICLRDLKNGRKWSRDRQYVEELMAFCRSLDERVEIVFLPFYPEDLPLQRDSANTLLNARWADYTSYVDIDGVLSELSSRELVVGEKLRALVLSAC